MYFASARDAVGKSREDVQFEGTLTVGELARRMGDLHPELRSNEKSTRYAVNFQIAEPDEVLHDGDEVGVLPAVTGG